MLLQGPLEITSRPPPLTEKNTNEKIIICILLGTNKETHNRPPRRRSRAQAANLSKFHVVGFTSPRDGPCMAMVYFSCMFLVVATSAATKP